MLEQFKSENVTFDVEGGEKDEWASGEHGIFGAASGGFRTGWKPTPAPGGAQAQAQRAQRSAPAKTTSLVWNPENDSESSDSDSSDSELEALLR